MPAGASPGQGQVKWEGYIMSLSSTVTIFYKGKVKELCSIGGTAYPGDEFGHFIFGNDIILHNQGQTYTFPSISIGPYFCGVLIFDLNIPHDNKFNMYFSSGHEAFGKNRLSMNYGNRELDITSNGWFKAHNNDHLLFCDPIVYFHFNSKTKKGSIKFEFTDLWNGVLKCEIDEFVPKRRPPVY